VREIKPIWTTASFLVYLGGLTVLLGGIYALAYLFLNYRGGGAQTAWALLILVILFFVAGTLRVAERWLAAGIFAFATVIAWGAFVGAAWGWFGWASLHPSGSAFQGWSLGLLVHEFLILVVALAFRRIWRFPFIAVISAVVGWLFVADLIAPNGNTWTYIVSLFIGLLYLAAGTVIDQPSAFWFHFVGGLLIGVPIYHWCHNSDFGFAIVLVVAVIFVLIAYATRRSSWAVFAAFGFFAATIHYAGGSPSLVLGGPLALSGGQECTSTATGQICHSIGPSSPSLWGLALGFGLLGFWLVFLGLLGRRRRATVPSAPGEPTTA
jgi:hypothetical protein